MVRPPIYAVIYRDLLSQVEAGRLRSGDRLDSEPALAEHYGVSRMTVRQALDQLVADHVVVRRRGSGTYVSSRAKGSRRLSRLGPFHDEVGIDQRAVRTDVKAQSAVVPPEEVREQLGLKPGQKAVRLVRLRIVERVPAAIQESWLPLTLAPGLARDKLVGGSLYRTLVERWDVRLRYAEVEISAAAADAEQAEWLQVAVGSPLVTTNRLTFGGEGEPVEFAHSWTRAEFPLVVRLEE